MDSKSKKPIKPALGRGLSALISSPVPIFRSQATTEGGAAIKIEEIQSVSKPTPSNTNNVQYIEISKILNNPSQPRQEFNESEILELSLSLKKLGVLQPILVRPSKKDSEYYEIIAGERRWRAAKLAGLIEVPVIVKDLDDRETLEVAIVENVQRENLNPIEQAQAYQRLSDEFKLSQEEIAEKVGKDRASVSNVMRLLKLPKEIIQNLKEGKLTIGHAKAILSIKDPSAQLSLSRKVVTEELSVRALESLVSRVVVLDAGRTAKKLNRISANDSQNEANYPEAHERLRRALGTKVKIKEVLSGRGRIEIEYFSEQELDRIIEKICQS